MHQIKSNIVMKKNHLFIQKFKHDSLLLDTRSHDKITLHDVVRDVTGSIA